MTGYGRGTAEQGAWRASVSVRTVNHRYADIGVKMQRRYQFAEDTIKKSVREYVSRGKIEVLVDIENDEQETVFISPDLATAKGYYRAMRELEKEIDVTGDITLEFIASQPDVLVSAPAEFDEAAVTEVCAAATRAACEELNDMRLQEGAKLAEDIIMRADIVAELLDVIETRAPELPSLYAEKLTARIEELSGAAIDSEALTARVALETAAMADKCNITEEIVRLRSHISQLKKLAGGSADGAPVGKKFDFLMQEMNREANTIGSKANDLKITEQMLEIKSEVEKIREQVQNIE
jgi:uncharacterized protein (TIGR00255 family)